MNKAARTRQFILEQTAPIFNKKGFEGTSMADMMTATGLTKGAIYGNFRDKEELGLEAFRYAIDRVRTMARDAVEEATTSKGQLLALLGFYARYVFDPPIAGGCPLLNAAIEVDDHRLSLRPVVAEELIRTIDFMASLLRRGVKDGEFKAGIRPKEIAYTLFCAVEGALMFSRVERSREPMDIVVRHCKTILDQISK